MPSRITVCSPVSSSDNPVIAINDFLFRKLDEGALSRKELSVVLRQIGDVVAAAMEKWDPEAPASRAVLTQAAFQMKKKLVELHTEFEKGLRSIGGGRRTR